MKIWRVGKIIVGKFHTRTLGWLLSSFFFSENFSIRIRKLETHITNQKRERRKQLAARQREWRTSKMRQIFKSVWWCAERELWKGKNTLVSGEWSCGSARWRMRIFHFPCLCSKGNLKKRKNFSFRLFTSHKIQFWFYILIFCLFFHAKNGKLPRTCKVLVDFEIERGRWKMKEGRKNENSNLGKCW